ncbi:hypothetical protein WN51_09528 [Melipona quadrifasciata]|uniref:Uncharacterized protein n=1 Tax=Melipona quadrifasciata TaxID=166423 RepID=A0A0M9A8Q7_9HYME|nr:hypothetical protein WN51_09528 [Melipona quadrifasciata]
MEERSTEYSTHVEYLLQSLADEINSVSSNHRQNFRDKQTMLEQITPTVYRLHQMVSSKNITADSGSKICRLGHFVLFRSGICPDPQKRKTDVELEDSPIPSDSVSRVIPAAGKLSFKALRSMATGGIVQPVSLVKTPSVNVPKFYTLYARCGIEIFAGADKLALWATKVIS